MATDRLVEYHADGWLSYNGGTRWRVIDGGAVEVEGEGAIRTRGEPVTMRTLMHDYGAAIRQASARFDVDIATIASMITIEAVKVRGTHHYDPRSNRFEPGYKSDRETPRKRSPGLMQTLLSTAEGANDRYGIYPGDPTTEDLFIPERSIMIGTAYLAMCAVAEGSIDPVLLCGAYNAGSVRPTKRNDFRVLTYGPDRIRKMLRFRNDLILGMGASYC